MGKARGVFIAMYGPDGIGKSRQAQLLEERLHERSVLVKSLRYPIYDQVPSGKILDEMLHKGRKQYSEEEMQKLFAQNRAEFEPTLKSWLDSGVVVIAENYKGTGMVWGTLRGLSFEQMEEINKDALSPDLSIFIDGPKREDAHPADHPYGDEDEWYKARKQYLAMADKFGWIRVGGDAPVLTVANRIWAVVRPVVEFR